MRKSFLLLILVVSCGLVLDVSAGKLDVVEWFPEPTGLRIVNQPEVAGIISNDISNVDLTQTFTLASSGSLSAIGFALSSAGSTSSVTVSLYRMVAGDVQPLPFAIQTISEDYFENIGPQTIPVWAYAEFSSTLQLAAGEQIAARIQAPVAQLWSPRRDALAGGEIRELPGDDLGFRAYVVPEPSVGILCVSVFCLLLVSRPPTKARYRRSRL